MEKTGFDSKQERFLFQAWVYCTYGPICSALKHAYGWTDAMVAMTANAGTAAYLVFTWPVRTPRKAID